ncbi:hypothetical protein WN48_07059 [Eufriesea mexicana]|uniref:Uncharacterized protein n=1 Tax=Eufriesea mexicana TaxID=516756 RepID=A0A310SMM0_9HYME|nr:hypothetical protein WN48_07059 [Eufriesea mexicana]
MIVDLDLPRVRVIFDAMMAKSLVIPPVPRRNPGIRDVDQYSSNREARTREPRWRTD